MMLWLCALIPYIAQAQGRTVEPIVLLPDSTQGYRVTRPWMEYAVRSMELRPLYETLIEDLRNEVMAANDQVYHRDMYIQNLEDDRDRVQQLYNATQQQLDEATAAIAIAEHAIGRAKLWRNIGGGLAVAILVIAFTGR